MHPARIRRRGLSSCYKIGGGSDRYYTDETKIIQVLTCHHPTRKINMESQIIKRKDPERFGQQPLIWRAKD